MKTGVISLAVASMLGLSLYAAAADNKWEVGLHPGIAMPTGKSKDIMKNSLGLQASVDYKCHDMFTGGAELGYSFGHKVEGTASGTAFTSDVKLKILQLTPTVKFGKTLDAGSFKWTPYGVLGAGLYTYKGQTGTLTAGAFTQALDIKGSTDFGFNLGGGVSIPIEQVSVGFDFRYHRAFEAGDDVTYITPSIRFSYLF